MSDTFDWRDMEKTGMGKTPEDIKEKCLKLCQNYLGGIWTKQTVDTIEVKRLTGGHQNQLYYCAISDYQNGVPEREDIPKEVAIKLHQKKTFMNMTEEEVKELELNDLIITLMTSENNLGPKVYGVFEDGVILKYYKQKPFKNEEQKNPELVRELFEKLARFHAMDVPIRRNTNIHLEQFDKNYELAIDHNFINDMVNENIKIFVENDFNKEYEWIRELIAKTKSPIVMTHNDYRSDNIMVLTNDNNNDELDKISRLVICDFEFSLYGYRGFDFVHIIKEWDHDDAHQDRHNVYFPPEDSRLQQLFEYYFDESISILGDDYLENPINSVQNLINEFKIFQLAIHFFLVLPFCNLLDEDRRVPEELLKFFGGKRPDKQKLMKLSERSYNNYWTLKNKYMEENVFVNFEN